MAALPISTRRWIRIAGRRRRALKLLTPAKTRFVRIRNGGDRAGFNGRPDLIPAVNLLMLWESGRQRCLKIDLFSGDGVVEFQILGVQEISSIAGEAGEIFKRLSSQAVQRIAYQGMADGCQMDSDLMRAARTQAYLKCSGVGGSGDHLRQ
jgi:hypothetical protein